MNDVCIPQAFENGFFQAWDLTRDRKILTCDLHFVEGYIFQHQVMHTRYLIFCFGTSVPRLKLGMLSLSDKKAIVVLEGSGVACSPCVSGPM